MQNCFFWFFLVFLEVFCSPKPSCPKTRRKLKKPKKNKKTNPVRRILGKSMQNCFFCFFLVFLEVFCSPKPNCPKTRRKLKKNKKTNPVRRILGKSMQNCFFCFFCFFRFFSRFLLSQALFFHTLMLPISLSTCRQKFGDDLGFSTFPSCLCGFWQWNALWNTLALCSNGHSKTKCFLLPRNGVSAGS